MIPFTTRHKNLREEALDYIRWKIDEGMVCEDWGKFEGDLYWAKMAGSVLDINAYNTDTLCELCDKIQFFPLKDLKIE